MNSPTQRSLAALRRDWPFVQVTERWNPWAKCRQDLFGFIDILCIRGNETMGVQTTSGDNMSHRLAKILALPAARAWRSSQTRRLQVHGWRKVGPRGKRKVWECRIREVTLEDFDSAPNAAS